LPAPGWSAFQSTPIQDARVAAAWLVEIGGAFLHSPRCVIFGDPNDEPSRRAQDDLTRAHPSGVVTRFSDYSGRQNIVVFRPAATVNP